MNDISRISRLSFFKMSKYCYDRVHICDFSKTPRPHYCMGMILKGKGVFAFENEEVHVKHGDIIFVPEGSTYISTWNGDPNIFYVSAHFSFESGSDFLRHKRIKIQKVRLTDIEKAKRYFVEMSDGCEGSKTEQFYAIGAFFNIIGMIFPKLIYTEINKIDSQIEKSVEYIEQNYSENISVDKLADMSNMSVSHFHSRFKSSMGCSPIEYKHRVCIHRAELMLIANKETSIEEISEALGFCSSTYFRRLFKKITGLSPRDYRYKSEEL